MSGKRRWFGYHRKRRGRVEGLKVEGQKSKRRGRDESRRENRHLACFLEEEESKVLKSKVKSRREEEETKVEGSTGILPVSWKRKSRRSKVEGRKSKRREEEDVIGR